MERVTWPCEPPVVTPDEVRLLRSANLWGSLEEKNVYVLATFALLGHYSYCCQRWDSGDGKQAEPEPGFCVSGVEGHVRLGVLTVFSALLCGEEAWPADRGEELFWEDGAPALTMLRRLYRETKVFAIAFKARRKFERGPENLC